LTADEDKTLKLIERAIMQVTLVHDGLTAEKMLTRARRFGRTV
jgi:hypothetical protein